MKTYLDCIPCFFKQALEAARTAGADEATQKKVLDELSKSIPKFPLEAPPPQMGRIVYGLVKEITGRGDPFKEIKQRFNNIALSLYPELKEKVRVSKDRLLTAVKLAIAGNVIDYGAFSAFDIKEEIKQVLNKDFVIYGEGSRTIFNFQEFKKALKDATTILYLADNAGEVVFDKVLIEELGKEVIYAVRDKPIINDALIEDAITCGVDKVAKVISSGSDVPGTILDLCSKEFLEVFKTADLIISKGQGNFETLAGGEGPIFFLFKAKCPVIAKEIGCQVGDIVLKKGE